MQKAINHVENHDLVDGDRDNPDEIEPRIPALAHGNDRRDWYARSRSRVATGLLLTAPGIPMLFMGQEFLEDKSWHNSPARDDLFLYWDGLKTDRAMQDFLRFTRELCWLPRRHPALGSEQVNVFHVHNDNRVLAFHRWLEGVGRDVVVVASLNESTFWQYDLGFPLTGRWLEVFNSDVYDHWVNPFAAGNAGEVFVSGGPRHGFAHSASIVIPANSVLVFARDAV